MDNSPISHLISNLSKRFQNVFMVSIASLKPSSMQYDVHLWNFGLPDFIFDDKAVYALGRGYVVIDRLIAQCPQDPALATNRNLPAPPHAHISRIRVFIFPSMPPEIFKMVLPGFETIGFQAAVHKPMGDVTDVTSISFIESMHTPQKLMRAKWKWQNISVCPIISFAPGGRNLMIYIWAVSVIIISGCIYVYISVRE